MSIIEKLKDKNYVRAFGNLSQEEKDYLCKVGKSNCDVCIESWKDAKDFTYNFVDRYRYAIKPDYQPEPEFVDLEIQSRDGMLCAVRKGGMVIVLHELPSLSNFEGFYTEDELVKGGDSFTFIDCVSREMNQGKKVFARLRSRKSVR